MHTTYNQEQWEHIYYSGVFLLLTLFILQHHVQCQLQGMIMGDINYWLLVDMFVLINVDRR